MDNANKEHSFIQSTNRRVRKAVDRMRLLAGQDPNGAGVPFRVDADGRLEVVSYRTNHVCRIYNNANISHATSGAFQAVTFNSESFDDDGMHDLVTNPDRITIIHAGLYLIGGSVQFDVNANGQRLVQVTLNGATVLQYGFEWAGAVHQPIANTTGIYSFSAGDYIQLMAWQNSGGALNMIAAAPSRPLFWAARL